LWPGHVWVGSWLLLLLLQLLWLLLLWLGHNWVGNWLLLLWRLLFQPLRLLLLPPLPGCAWVVGLLLQLGGTWVGSWWPLLLLGHIWAGAWLLQQQLLLLPPQSGCKMVGSLLLLLLLLHNWGCQPVAFWRWLYFCRCFCCVCCLCCVSCGLVSCCCWYVVQAHGSCTPCITPLPGFVCNTAPV
jgi:hypothetical protein